MVSSSLVRSLVAAGALALATGALADGGPRRYGGSLKDDYTYAPAPFSWTGFYLGGHAGGAWSDHGYNHVQPFLPLDERLEFSSSGFTGGGQVGYQAQFSNWVMGVELSYSAMDLEQSQVSGAIADRSRTMSISDLFLASVRVGTTWDRWLLYVKGGYASAEVDIRSNVISSGVVTSSSSEREGGWNLGAGLEYAISPNVILGVQYDYVSLSGSDRWDTDKPGFGITDHRSIDADIHAVTARLNWKFNP
jgi:outer membrane immunogenic protein